MKKESNFYEAMKDIMNIVKYRIFKIKEKPKLTLYEQLVKSGNLQRLVSSKSMYEACLYFEVHDAQKRLEKIGEIGIKKLKERIEEIYFKDLHFSLKNKISKGLEILIDIEKLNDLELENKYSDVIEEQEMVSDYPQTKEQALKSGILLSSILGEEDIIDW